MDKLAKRTLEQLRRALPRSEHEAISAWLTTFFPYQQNWILDPVRFALLVKARQIGASHSFAGWALIRAILGQLTTVISVGQREADEVIDKAGRHARALVRLGSKLARPIGRSSTDELRVASGGRILSLPVTSGGRSYSGNVILDEAAYYQHAEKVWDGASAVVMHSGSLRVLSTPNGVGNLFYELVTSPKAHQGYRVHRTTIQQAIADGLRVSLPELWKMARHNPRVFDQLFGCAFLGRDEASIIGFDAVTAAKKRYASMLALGPLDLGVDPSRFGDDESVIFPRRGTKLLEPIVFAHADGAQVAIRVLEYVRNHRIPGEPLPRVKVDGIGVGASVVDQLRPFNGEEIDLYEVNVSEVASDEERYTNLRAELWFAAALWLIDEGGIPDDPVLERELLTPNFSFDPKRRLKAESKDEIRKRLGRSPDRADAAILAIYEPPSTGIHVSSLLSRDGYRMPDDVRGFG